MGRHKENKIYSMFCYNAETKKSKCLMEGCEKYVAGNHAGNLTRHFFAQHRQQYNEIIKLNEESKKQVPENPTPNSVLVMEYCTQLVTVHGRPFNVVEDEAFIKLLNLIPGMTEKHVQAVNVKNIKENIRKKAHEVRLQINKEIGNNLIALKVDVASVKLRRFLGLNMQYVLDGKTKLRNLSVVELHDRNTAAYLKENVALSLSRYGIELNQILTITTDNGANMLSMVNQINQCIELPANEIEVYNENIDDNTVDDEIENRVELNIEANNVVVRKVTSVRCAAHCLQLAVKGACQDIQGFLEKCRQIMRRLRTPNMSLRLKEENLPQAVLDTPTRWDSTADMLLSLQKLKTFVVMNLDFPAEILDSLESLDTYVEVLQPCRNLSQLLQREQLTCGDFFIAWMRCRHELALLNHPFARKLEDCMTIRQDMLFENEYFLAALYLDPRVNSILTNEQATNSRQILANIYVRLENLHKQNTPDASDLEPQPGTSTEEQRSNFDEYLRTAFTQHNNRNRVANNTLENEIKFQLTAFLQEPLLPSDNNILQYWETRKLSHPYLYNIAKVVLATPPTSVSVERLFSSLKFVLNNLRMRLDNLIIEDVMVVRNNHLYGN